MGLIYMQFWKLCIIDLKFNKNLFFCGLSSKRDIFLKVISLVWTCMGKIYFHAHCFTWNYRLAFNKSSRQTFKFQKYRFSKGEASRIGREKQTLSGSSDSLGVRTVSRSHPWSEMKGRDVETRQVESKGKLWALGTSKVFMFCWNEYILFNHQTLASDWPQRQFSLLK